MKLSGKKIHETSFFRDGGRMKYNEQCRERKPLLKYP